MPVRLLLAAIVAVVLAGPAGADGGHPKKPFHVALAPAAAAAGATVDAFTVTLTNKAHPQKLGSANITVPAALTIVGEPSTNRGSVSRSGNLLKLRDLAIPPNGSATVTLGLRMPCAAGAYKWAVEAKQANDFHGSGNSFGPVSGTLSTTVAGGCRLRFVGQPASAERNAQIRADAFQPASAQLVSVEVVDGSAAPQRLTWFTGTVDLRLVQAGPGTLFPNPASSAAVAGLASFSNLSIDRSGNYNLRATTAASGFGSSVSEQFQIIGVVEPCTASSCTATLAGAESTSTVTGSGGSGTGFVLLSLNLGREPVCAGYTPAASDWYEFLTTVPRDKTVKATFGKAAVREIGGVWKLQICFAAPASFPAKGGAAQPFDYDGDPGNGAEGFVGLLPNCPYKPKAPCILKREGDDDDYRHDKGGGGATVKFLVPAAWGDPRYGG